MQGVKYIVPEPDYYHHNMQPKQYQKQQNQNVYLPPPPSIEDTCTWYGRGRGRVRHLELHGHRLYGEKKRSLESQLEKKHKKIQHLQECRAVRTLFIVRHNLTMHCSVTPFVIRQPIQRPRLLERVYKPMRTSH